MELTYHEGPDGLLYPDLELREQEDYELGMYGKRRREYLKTRKRTAFQLMLMKDELWPHLVEVDRRATEMENQIIRQMAAQNGVTDELKARNQMEWVRRMNNLTQAAQEIVMNELVYQ